MIEVERSIVILRPKDEVFAYVSDLRNERTYHIDVLESRRTSTVPLGVGATYEMKMKPFGGVDHATARVTAFAPGRFIEFESVMGKMRATRFFRVEPVKGGTRVTHGVKIQPFGMMVVMAPVMRRMIGKSWEGFLERLKRLLEEGASVGPRAETARVMQ